MIINNSSTPISKMSEETICQSFVENAWRKDICSNCFRLRDEHLEKEINNSGKNAASATTTTGTISSTDNNGSIVPSTTSSCINKIKQNINAALLNDGGGAGNKNNNPWSSNKKVQKSAAPPVPSAKPSFSQNQGLPSSQSCSGTLEASRKSNDSNSAINGSNKFSGTNSTNSSVTASTTTKGYIHSTLNGSRNSIHSSNNSINNNVTETNDPIASADINNGKLKSEATTLSKSSPSLPFSTTSSSANKHQHPQSQIISQPQLQGKGVMTMTNQHPSKRDSGSVISPSNHHQNNNNNERQAMTSSSSTVSLQQQQEEDFSSTARGTTGRNISSFIASKNVFNNNASNDISKLLPLGSTTGTATGFIPLNSTNTTSPPSTTASSPSVNAASNAATSNNSNVSKPSSYTATGSANFSHPQSVNSIKRGNIAPSSSSSSSSTAAVLVASSSNSSEIVNASEKNCGAVGGLDAVISCNSASTSAAIVTGTNCHNEKFDNCVKNGVIKNSNKKELSEGVGSNNNISNISVQSAGNHSVGSERGNKEGNSEAIGMNRGKVASSVSTMNGEFHERRKIGFASANVNVSEKVTVSSTNNGKMEKLAKVTGKKGILRSKSGSKASEKNVRFPEEVVRVIGYGGDPSGASDDEDDTPTDPLDNASVAEVMEKNSNTMEEKELHRLTQKNTNFNSIKTNLLGTTCIEIGPIVGCTGGKSMEGSSKPLVSIGTFEARKEPLKIQKKISEDSADDELNEKTVEKHRKFIQKSNARPKDSPEVTQKNTKTAEERELHRLTQKNTNFNSINTNLLGTTKSSGEVPKGNKTLLPTLVSTQVPSKINPASSKSISDNSQEEEVKQQETSRNKLKSISHAAPSSSSATGTTINSSLNKASLSTKSLSSTSSQSALPLINKRSGITSSASATTTTTIEVKPEQTTNATRSSRENVSTKGSNNNINQAQSATTSSPSRSIASNAGKWGGGSSAGVTSGTVTGIPSSTTTTSIDNNLLKNTKPVLKRIQQKINTTNAPDKSTIPVPQLDGASSSSSYTVNAAVVETNNNKINSTSSKSGQSERIILTNGGNVGFPSDNSNSIASKRSSFLRDIILDSSVSETTTIATSTTGGNELLQRQRDKSGPQSANNNEVQVICKNNSNSKVSSEASVIKSELKVDLKPSVNNGKLSHPPFGECLSNQSNGTDDSSEFDDSLEDSGLDIKKCSEISESDEKSGSGSDSGNENDYSERGDRVKIISTTGPKSGLYISVEEVDGNSKKPEKLSPDSVLFSSASEMSASGSSESIPEALNTAVSVVSVEKSSTLSENESGNGISSTSIIVKRAAPRPPANSTVVVDSSVKIIQDNNNAIYANGQQSSALEEEELYDDVSFYKNPMHFTSKTESKKSVFEGASEENIYDDCSAITTGSKLAKKSGGKSAGGSYSFQNGSPNALDSDGEEEEKVVHRRSDGIEFIGIRKIDSESFLRERSPTPEKSPEGKRERSSSASPKTRRKVNQFFSTIGKRAGAAFSQHMHSYSSKNKSNPVIDGSNDGVDKSPSGSGSTAYKRSLSTDEVSMTRTQEIYATLTPTSLKFKGLAPVLHKLSKIDLNLGDKDKGGDTDDDSKGYKKHKISSSIKKFLRIGSKDGGEGSGSKFYDFGNCQNKTDTNGLGQLITSQISEEPISDTSSSISRTPTPTTSATSAPVKIPERKPSVGTMSSRPPPPPPPRVHSLDLLNRVGVAGPNGTVRPARPPPPARHNRVAPSFTSVFNNQPVDSRRNADEVTTIHVASGHSEDVPDPNNPPSKPKRKASINTECASNGVSKDLETTYNHITTLNLETLKLIASQTPTKIRRSNKRGNSSGPLRWSQFQLTEPYKPLIHGDGFVFYSATLGDEQCVLLVQESATAPNFSAPFEFPCVETSATFEDSIPMSFITWKASVFVTNGNNVKVFVSVMPKYNMYTVENYMHNSQVPLLHKYFALLQAMNYWDKEDMSDLLVLVQNMEDLDYSSSRATPSPDMPFSSPSSVLVYVHPIPPLSSLTNGSGTVGGKHSLSKGQLSANFEKAMKQILISNGGSPASPLLGDNDRQVLLKRLNENQAKTAEDLFRLFLQVKLFTPKRDSEELERIKKLRSVRAIQQWLDRERAMCMKEAVEQTLQRNVESSISPYKRSYLEFLLIPDNSAKSVLDMLIDMLE